MEPTCKWCRSAGTNLPGHALVQINPRGKTHWMKRQIYREGDGQGWFRMAAWTLCNYLVAQRPE